MENSKNILIGLLNIMKSGTYEETIAFLNEQGIIVNGKLVDSKAIFGFTKNRSLINLTGVDPIAALHDGLVVNAIDSIVESKILQEGNGLDVLKNYSPQDAAKRAFPELTNPLEGLALTEFAKNLRVIAMGGSNQSGTPPTIAVADKGTGLSGRNFEQTLGGGEGEGEDKINIAGQKGKYGLGAQAPLAFCKGGLSAIVMRERDPDTNISAMFWTITQYEHTEKGKQYRFLVDPGTRRIPEFHLGNDYVIDLPGVGAFESGVVRYLSEYNQPARAFPISLDLGRKLAARNWDNSFPIRVEDKRQRKSSAHSLENNYQSLKIRLEKLKQREPRSFEWIRGSMLFDSTVLKVHSLVFDDIADMKKQYFTASSNGVYFSSGGQIEGAINKRIFKSSDVYFPYISDRLRVVVELEGLDEEIQEAILAADRTNVRDSPHADMLKEKLCSMLRGNQELKDLNFEYGQRAKQGLIEINDKSAQKMWDALWKDRGLAQEVFEGKIAAPEKDIGFKKVPVDKISKPVVHSYFAHYWYPVKDQSKESPKLLPVSQEGGRIDFFTNAPADYFERPKNAGKMVITIDGREIRNEDGFNELPRIENGVARLTFGKPKWATPGRMYMVKFAVSDEGRRNANNGEIEPFESDVWIQITEAKKMSEATNIGKKNGSQEISSGNRSSSAGPGMPSIRWDEYATQGFKVDDVLRIIKEGNNNEFWLNKKNSSLQREIKGARSENEIKQIHAMWQFEVVSFATSQLEGLRNSENMAEDIEENVAEILKGHMKLFLPKQRLILSELSDTFMRRVA